MSAVLCSIENRIARITLNRPDKGNGLNSEMAAGFAAAVESIAANPAVRVVIITGAGKRFCVGGDIEAFAANLDGMSGLIAGLVRDLGGAVARLAQLPVVVITALNGAVGGGGIGVALCADRVVAAESAKMGTGYSAIGLSPDVGASWQVTRRIGAARAKELFLTNRPVGAAEMLQLGLVNGVVPDAELAATVDRMAETLANAAHGSTLSILQLTDSAATNTLEQHLALEAKNMVAAAGTPDAREGVQAFLQKRKPTFS